ncbi:MAG: hypothetical protein ACTS5I_03570, partial [Rhodanobacter sp.]
MNGLYLRRRITNAAAMVLSLVATLIGLAFLAWILWETLRPGISALDLKELEQHRRRDVVGEVRGDPVSRPDRRGARLPRVVRWGLPPIPACEVVLMSAPLSVFSRLE